MRKKRNLANLIWHCFIFLLSIGSLAEVIFGFLPIPAESEVVVKVFFMGLTLIGFFYEITDHLTSSYFNKNNLEEMVKKGLTLSKQNRVESAVLLDIENDLDETFGTNKGSFHIIIVTACLNQNEAAYINAIWKNINNNVKYLYVTPDDDQSFINSLIRIFSEKGYNEDIVKVYQQVVHNISHVSRPELFDILPENYDLCIYCKDNNKRISIEGALGFCCFQDELYRIGNHTYTFYYPLGKGEVSKVFNRFAREFDKERILQPYVSPKIEIKNSSIHGLGMYCKAGEEIKPNEVVMIKGGYELHRNQMAAQKVIDSYLPISDDLFLAAKTPEEENCVKLFINHSCSPNVGMLNERTFVAMRSIKSGEELTMDYAFVDNEDYRFKCYCGSPYCRETVTGFDWKNVEIQKKYYKYFSPYLQRKMKTKRRR